jgi:hypothetical protein
MAAAQACMGSIAPSAPNTSLIFAGGTADLVDQANAFGGRISRMQNTDGRVTGVWVGARSISGGSKSILAVDFGLHVSLTKSETNAVCLFAGADLVNLSDSENGYANVPFGLSWGHVIAGAQGGVSYIPFGTIGGNLNSSGDSSAGEFSSWAEAGIGFRMANGFTVTPSLRQSFETGADPVIRILAMFPLRTSARKR